MTIRGQFVRHSTAARDWVCGECGSRVVTRHTGAGWRTVCFDHPEHDDQTFVHKHHWAYLDAWRQMDTIKASEVFDHLPTELQAAILANS